MRERWTRRRVLITALAAVPVLAACTVSGSVQQQHLQQAENATPTPTPGTPTAVSTSSTPAGTPTPAPPTPLPSPQPTMTPGGQVALHLGAVGSSAGQDAFRTVAESYSKTTPKTTVTVDAISNTDDLSKALAGGTALDIVVIPWDTFANLAPTGLLDDITSLLGGGTLDSSGLFQLPKDYATVGGRTLGLPLSYDPRVLYVNLDLFASAAVSAPTSTFDWQHFQEAASKISKGDVNGFVPGTSPFDWFPWVWAAGGSVFDDELSPTTCQLADSASTSGLQQYADLWLKHEGAAAPSSVAPVDAFVAGKAGMVAGSRADLAALKRATFKWQVAYLPQGPGGHAATYTATFGAVGRSSRQPYPAAQLLGFLATDKAAQTLLARTGTVVPALQEAATGPDFKTQGVDIDDAVFTKTLLFSYQPPRTPAWAPVQSAWSPDLDQLWSGKQSAQDAAKAAVPKVNDALKKAATPTTQPFAVQPPPPPTPTPKPGSTPQPPTPSALPTPPK